MNKNKFPWCGIFRWWVYFLPYAVVRWMAIRWNPEGPTINDCRTAEIDRYAFVFLSDKELEARAERCKRERAKWDK